MSGAEDMLDDALDADEMAQLAMACVALLAWSDDEPDPGAWVAL